MLDIVYISIYIMYKRKGFDLSKRINIAIPDKLFDRLQNVKKNINVSKVCTEAIGQSVKIEELKKKENANLDDLAKRIIEEMKLEKKKERESGFEAGIADAKHLSYKQFLQFSKWFHETKREEAQNPSCGVGEEYWYMFEQYAPSENVQKRENETRLFSDVEYERGWCEGVNFVWEKILDKVRDYENEKR